MMHANPSSTPARSKRGAFLVAAAALALLCGAWGCSSTWDVKYTVTSEPPGGYIVYQVLPVDRGDADWIHIGITPLVTVRQEDKDALESAKSVTIKTSKQGYFDQTKVWSGKEFVKEVETKGGVFWNPRLVESK
jgi:hypothetical protein